jgi:CRP-like cAMP-binding protein
MIVICQKEIISTKYLDANRRLAQWRVKWFIEHYTSYQVLCAGLTISCFVIHFLAKPQTTGYNHTKTHDHKEMKEIIQLSTKEITLERNEFLKVKGSIDTNLYFIESGSLRIFVLDEYEEQTIRFGYRGNLIVSLDSFLTRKPSDLFIQAIKKTLVKVVTKPQIDNFLEIESNRNLWIKILENLVIQQMEREVDILTNSPKKRYERVLKRSPQLFQEIPNRHIANYLRMSAETLSRLKKS